MKPSHFAVFQFGGIHLHFVDVIAGEKLPASTPMGDAYAVIRYKTPCFPLIVGDLPWIVDLGFVRLAGCSAKQGGHSFRSLLASYASHFDLAAEILIF